MLQVVNMKLGAVLEANKTRRPAIDLAKTLGNWFSLETN